jgi:predicted O-methyltransferase YrrM
MLPACRQALVELVRRAFQLPNVRLDALAPRPRAPPELVDDHRNMPPRAHCPHDDMGALLRIVTHRRPRRIVELGTAHGNTVANICAHSDARVVTVNALPEQISGVMKTFTLSREEIGCVYRKYGFADRVTQVYENTLHLHPKCLGEDRFDMAIIDACHDKDFVVNDFYKVLPALRRGAVVLLHDTHPSREGHLKGSYDACVRLRISGFAIRHIEGTWWGYYVHIHRGRKLIACWARGIWNLLARRRTSGKGHPLQQAASPIPRKA